MVDDVLETLIVTPQSGSEPSESTIRKPELSD
jgi:hypothetical protein